MAYTKFGEFVRILRIKNHEVMGDMARVLDVKVPFLSAVESGKRNAPKEWINILCSHYDLSDEERKELENSIEESKTQVKVNLIGSGKSQRKAALSFARSFDDMDDDTAEKIIKLLEDN